MLPESSDEPIGTELLFENDNVRIWKLVVGASSGTTWHQHRVPYVYVVIEPGSVQTEYGDGTAEAQADHRGDAVFRADTQPHRLVNLGNTRYENIVIELKKG